MATVIPPLSPKSQSFALSQPNQEIYQPFVFFFFFFALMGAQGWDSQQFPLIWFGCRWISDIGARGRYDVNAKDYQDRWDDSNTRQQTRICVTALVGRPDGVTSRDSPLTRKRNQYLQKYFLILSFKFCNNQFWLVILVMQNLSLSPHSSSLEPGLFRSNNLTKMTAK